MFSAFDSWCRFCGDPNIEYVDRITNTDHYGWVHYRCAAQLCSTDEKLHTPLNRDGYPKLEKAELFVGEVPQHQCAGMKKDGTQCSRSRSGVAVNDGVHYCGTHEKQRPDGVPGLLLSNLRPSNYFSTIKVVGESHAGNYPEALNRAAEMLAATDNTGERLPAVLVLEPENPVDPGAVAVHLPSLNQRIGYLPMGEDKDRAALALQAGAKYEAFLTCVAYNDFADPEGRKPGARIAYRQVTAA